LNENSGRIDVDELLQVKGHEDLLYALGDSATVPVSDANGGFAGTAQVAIQQAEYAAWNVWASLTGKKKLRYRYMHLGEMMVLGSRDGSVSTKLGVEADGVAGWAMRRAAYAARMPTERQRAQVAASWAVSPLVRDAPNAFARGGCLGNMQV
jgi:NADH dehydrogenase FAD-containing subunit